MQNQKEFIYRLRELMKANGDNTVTLAKKIGAKSQSITHWLSEQRIPKIIYLENIADNYGVSVDYLLGRADY
jgi:transcriptional regulator with XRE-family HTH domain